MAEAVAVAVSVTESEMVAVGVGETETMAVGATESVNAFDLVRTKASLRTAEKAVRTLADGWSQQRVARLFGIDGKTLWRHSQAAERA